MAPLPRSPVALKTSHISTTEAVKPSSLAALRGQTRSGAPQEGHPQNYVSVGLLALPQESHSEGLSLFYFTWELPQWENSITRAFVENDHRKSQVGQKRTWTKI